MPRSTEQVVDVIRSLVTFAPGQSGAYRELFGPVAEQLGPDVESKLNQWLVAWAKSGRPGLVILTGNAGTGKTAATQAYCTTLGFPLPESDLLTSVGSALVAKDISALPDRSARAEAFRTAMSAALTRQVLLCANEGVYRDAAEDLAVDHPELEEALDSALRAGVASREGFVTLNLNRQRLTSPTLWTKVLDFLTREEIWSNCDGCPLAPTVGTHSCPMQANVAALRRHDVREALRHLVRLASGETVPTMREVLSLLAYSICGDASGDSTAGGMWTCDAARSSYRDRGAEAFSVASAYYNLVFGAGIGDESWEKSPLLVALRQMEVGEIADLQMDEWLRDSGTADSQVKSLAGSAQDDDPKPSGLSGSNSHLDVIRTKIGQRTYHQLGETLSISEEPDDVAACTDALIDPDLPAQSGWRRRLFFEASEATGGLSSATTRLLGLSFSRDLFELNELVANGEDFFVPLKAVVRGLNYLVTGHADSSEGLVVPEPASLFARNPGSFRPARPAFVHSKIPVRQITLAVPDSGAVAEVLDVDHVELILLPLSARGPRLMITPRLYQAVREAERFRGPVSHSTSEMTQLRTFYGQLAESGEVPEVEGLLVADPERGALVPAVLPHVGAGQT